MIDKIYRATLTSRNFRFEAYGDSESSAKNVLIDGLVLHAKQYNLPRDWYVGHYEIEVSGFEFCRAYRDDQPLPY